MANCPVCATAMPEYEQLQHNWTSFNCPRCGYCLLIGIGQLVLGRLEQKLGDWTGRSIGLRSRLSHILRRQQRSDGGLVQIPIDRLEDWHLDERLPTPGEQLNNLMLWIGDHQPTYAESALLQIHPLSAWIGAPIIRSSPGAGVAWLLDQDNAKRFIERRGDHQGSQLVRLSIEGWQHYENLKQGHVESRNVLMAMKFNDAELDNVITQCFRPAVKRAGFELHVLTDHARAGLIDDQLRVALRTSRFIVADVTHGSNGAYWEAGFAEGLGRPVIYTCREKEWSEHKSHFDTNHMHTIIWSSDKLNDVGERLTATIRATVPEEAKMTDG